MPTVELRFAPQPANVRTARLLAGTLARRFGADEALVDELKLAVGEACTRAVSIHQAYAPEEPVEITFASDGSAYVVTVRDRGPAGADLLPDAGGTELGELPELGELDALPPGFGLAIVAGLVDAVVVTPADPGTEIRMSWQLGAEPPSRDVAVPRDLVT